jgi:tryptophanyl-tRNA synthetase
VVGAFAPIRERAEEMLADEAELDKLLAHGAGRARAIAGPTMAAVIDRVGFLPGERAR